LHYSKPEKLLALPLASAVFLCGICACIAIPELPAMAWCMTLAIVALFLIFLGSNSFIHIIAIFILGFAFMAYNVNQLLSKELPAALEGQRVRLIGTISSVVEDSQDHKLKILLKVNSLTHASEIWPKPGLVQLTWEHADQPVMSGDKWSIEAKLKRPRAYANPGSFDMEKFAFQQRISAIGYIPARSSNQLVQSNYDQTVNRWRQKILAQIVSALSGCEFVGVVVALVLGEKSLVLPAHWLILQNSGTAHLMAISGMHISLVTSLVFGLLRLMWRFVPRSWLFLPATLLAASGSIFAVSMYATLSGMSISTQRALIMIIVLFSGVLCKRKISASQRYSLALIAVLLWEPFVVLSIGFWLSFLAVGSLLYAYSGRWHLSQTTTLIWRWLRPQCLIAIALLPCTLLFFAQAPIVAPLINLIAIPWVCLLVLPLSLLGILTLAINNYLGVKILQLAEVLVAYLWPLLKWCSTLAVYLWRTPDKNLIYIICCAMLGAVWIFVPKGIPGRLWGILGFMPLFFARSDLLAYSQANFTLLDVGQGLAAVVRTQNHVLVYDTGAKLNTNFDLGSRVVAPYLQSQGIKQIDILFISHADNDHIGGAKALMSKVPTLELMINDLNYLPEYDRTQCLAGQNWVWDGVQFNVLHPNENNLSKNRNDNSCVLLVQAGEHKVLLTGDIEAKAEQYLLHTYGSRLQADILVVPHHGSKTSSSWEFLEQVQPKFALVPAGYKNQYGHPKELILARYAELGSQIYNTAVDGAISFHLLAGEGLDPDCFRKQRHWFWSAQY
jgi:competence protein ComEC